MESSSEAANLGKASNLAIIKKPGSSERLLFVGMSGKAEKRWVRTISRGSAQTLWYHLTHILYPRAADQLTPRAQTALFSPEDMSKVTTGFFVASNDEKGLIYVRGVGGPAEWEIYFTKEEGYELWASLEDVLGAV